jgi:hypothetical protein
VVVVVVLRPAMPVRRGHVAPRTTIIETIIRKFDTNSEFPCRVRCVYVASSIAQNVRRRVVGVTGEWGLGGIHGSHTGNCLEYMRSTGTSGTDPGTSRAQGSQLQVKAGQNANCSLLGRDAFHPEQSSKRYLPEDLTALFSTQRDS